MLSKLKNLSFTFSPKAFLSVVPTVVPFGIQEFNFFRFFITFFTTLENRRTILTLEFYLQEVKLFNSFLCKTTHTLNLLKNCLRLYYLIIHFITKTFNYFEIFRVSDSSPPTREGVFLNNNIKCTGVEKRS